MSKTAQSFSGSGGGGVIGGTGAVPGGVVLGGVLATPELVDVSPLEAGAGALGLSAELGAGASGVSVASESLGNWAVPEHPTVSHSKVVPSVF